MAQPSPYSLSASLTEALYESGQPPAPPSSSSTTDAHRSAVSDYLYVVNQASQQPGAAPVPSAAMMPPAGYATPAPAAPAVPTPAPAPAPAPAGYHPHHPHHQVYRPPDLSPSPVPPVSAAAASAAPGMPPSSAASASAAPPPGHTSTPHSAAYASTYGYDGTHADRNVFDRLNDPATYTGVYAERFTSGPAINHASDAHRTPRGQAFPVATHLHQKVASYLSSKHHTGPTKAHKAASHSVSHSDGLPYWALHESPRDRARRRSVAHRRPAGFKKGDFAASNNARLLLIFRYYCAFGLTGSKKADQDTICNTNFAKFTRECPALLDSTDRIAGAGAGLNPTEVDMIFIQVKKNRHRRRLTYTEFLAALDRMAQVKYSTDDPETAFSKLLINHVFPSEGAQVVEAAEALEGDMSHMAGVDHLSSDPASPYPGMSPSPSFRPPTAPHIPPSPVPMAAGGPMMGHAHPHHRYAPPHPSPLTTPAAPPPPPTSAAAAAAGMPYPAGPPATPTPTATPGMPTPTATPPPPGAAAYGYGHPHPHAHPHPHHAHHPSSSGISVMSDMSTASAAVRRANVAEARRRHREAHYKAPPSRRKTIAGEANRPGGVFDRLSNPATFTGVYRRAWYSDGRINHYADTMVSNIPSQYEGDTNTKTDEIITDISVLLRPGLRYGKGLK